MSGLVCLKFRSLICAKAHHRGLDTWLFDRTSDSTAAVPLGFTKRAACVSGLCNGLYLFQTFECPGPRLNTVITEAAEAVRSMQETSPRLNDSPRLALNKGFA